MNQKNIKRMKYIFSILFFILAFVSILKIYPQIHPLTQTNFVVTKDQAEGIAKEFLNGEIPENEQEIATSFIINKELYEQRNELENLGYSSFIQIDKYWEIGITSTKSKKSGLVLSSDSDNLTFRDKNGDWYFVRISPNGEILKLDFEKPRRDCVVPQSIN